MGAVRLVMALVVMALSAVAISYGANVAIFSWSRWGAVQPNETAWAERSSYLGLPLASRAAAVMDPGRMRELRTQVIDTLEQSPLSSRGWLALSGVNLILGEPKEQVVNPLTMSAITGPNNLDLLATRAIMSVLMWEALPPERRLGAATDLITAVRMNTLLTRQSQLTAALSIKSKEVRRDIRNHLLMVEGSSEPILTYLGLPESEFTTR